MKIGEVWSKWKVQILCVAGGFLLYGAGRVGGALENLNIPFLSGLFG